MRVRYEGDVRIDGKLARLELTDSKSLIRVRWLPLAAPQRVTNRNGAYPHMEVISRRIIRKWTKEGRITPA